MKPPAAPVAEHRLEDWDEVLDAMEQALGTGEAYEPPPGLPSMPDRLVPRARAILERQRRAIAELSEERTRVGEELTSRRRSAPRAAHAPTGAALSL